MKKILIIIFLIILCISIFSEENNNNSYCEVENINGEKVTIPLNTIVLSNFYFREEYIMKLIDLEINEIVLIYYVFEDDKIIVKQVIWTGIKVNSY